MPLDLNKFNNLFAVVLDSSSTEDGVGVVKTSFSLFLKLFLTAVLDSASTEDGFGVVKISFSLFLKLFLAVVIDTGNGVLLLEPKSSSKGVGVVKMSFNRLRLNFWTVDVTGGEVLLLEPNPVNVMSSLVVVISVVTESGTSVLRSRFKSNVDAGVGVVLDLPPNGLRMPKLGLFLSENKDSILFLKRNRLSALPVCFLSSSESKKMIF